jgi:cobalt-zinc-cadmium efflux system outer membrane protein
MRVLFLSSLILLAGAAAPGAACAGPVDVSSPAPPPDAPPLTLPDAVREALDRHPDLDVLRARAAAMRARPDVERHLMAPMLEAQVFQWPLDTIRPSQAQVMFTLAQDLAGRGKRALRTATAEREGDVAASRVDARGLEIVADVKRAYADLWLARQTRSVYEATVSLLRELADAAEARYTTGRSTQADIVKALVERSRLEEQIVAADEQARIAEARLNTLMRRAPGAAIGPVADPPPHPHLPDSPSLAARALERHPDLAVADGETAVAGAEVALAERERRPDYVLRGGFMIMPDSTNAWTASLGVTWPTAPWTRRRTEALARAAAAQRDATASDRRAIEYRLRAMVHDAWLRADSARRRAGLLQTSVLPQAGYALDLSRTAYQTDRASLVDVLDAQRLLLDLRLDVHRAIAERERALADLELAVGSDIGADAQPAAAVSRTPAAPPGASR